MPFSTDQEEGGDSKGLDALINGEGRDLNLLYSLILVNCVLPVFARNWLSSSSLPNSRSYLLSLARDGTKGDGLGHFS